MTSKPAPQPDPQEDGPWLEPVLETVAREVHDEWWRRRLSEGWSYGARRDEC